MADTLNTVARSERMSRIKGADTGPELRVRSLIHRLGFRFRLHRKDLPGRPDIVLPKHRVVVFVHGCFWHRHEAATCKLARWPKSRLSFWKPKLEANRERDLRNEEALRQLGWRVLTVWECELKDEQRVSAMIRSFVRGRKR